MTYAKMLISYDELKKLIEIVLNTNAHLTVTVEAKDKHVIQLADRIIEKFELKEYYFDEGIL